jgi:uncharacterized protein (TIGR02271 family)
MARIGDGLMQWREHRTIDMPEGAGIGAAVGGLIGLVAGLIPLWIPGLNWVIEEGAVPSALVGAVIGAVVGALMRQLRGMDLPRREETGLAAPARSDRARGMHEEQVVPVVQEELAIGKREVTKGGIRVHTRVASVPAEQSVQLREEHATIERVAVDRPVAAGEDLFKERTFEVLEMAEEAVVQKRSRVKEEVRIAKQVAERTETVRETVRKTEVEVEHTAGRAERRVNNGPYAGQERRLAVVRR